MSKELKPVAWKIYGDFDYLTLAPSEVDKAGVLGWKVEPLYAITEGYALAPVEQQQFMTHFSMVIKAFMQQSGTGNR